jgi:hypothetical protein
MTKQFWIGLAAYVLPTFPLAYSWHLTTFAANYAALALLRPDPIIPFGFVTMLIQGAILSWAYPRLFSSERADWVKSAFKCFCVYGLLAWSWSVLAVSAKYHMTSVADFMMLETGWTILQFAVFAPLIALVWRKAD